MTEATMNLLSTLRRLVAEYEQWVAEDDPLGIFYDDDVKLLNETKEELAKVLASVEA